MYLRSALEEAELVVCAWGNHGNISKRAPTFLEWASGVSNLHCLDINKGGQPKHPLYVPANLPPRMLVSKRTATGNQ